jgi:hypothetical protein
MGYYDRYEQFKSDGVCRIVPFIKISTDETDLYINYNKSLMRLDRLSYEYYSDPNYAWLILLANPKQGSMEFEIKDNAVLRIPYPLSTALKRYESAIESYNSLKSTF